jgi:IMP dehydrogenase
MAKRDSKISDIDGLTFDDLLLLPNYTEILREQANPATKLHPTIHLKLPFLSAPMDTVTEADMAIAMAQGGGLGIIHRNLQVQVEAEMVKKAKSARVIDAAKAAVDAKGRLLVGAAVGAGADLQERVKALVEAGADVIVVDSGHGYSKYIMDAVKTIKKMYPKQAVMAGNVATAEEWARAASAPRASSRVSAFPRSPPLWRP